MYDNNNWIKCKKEDCNNIEPNIKKIKKKKLFYLQTH